MGASDVRRTRPRISVAEELLYPLLLLGKFSISPNE